MKVILQLTLSAIFIVATSCADFIEIDSPRTELVASTVFENDATANAAMLSIYYELKRDGFASGSISSISFVCSLSADEQMNFSVEQFQQFNDNELSPDNSFVSSLWSPMYNIIYQANAMLEGLANSANVSDGLKAQLEGEAKFLRSFCYFYLVNLFGDVPLVVTTDYRRNAAMSRTPSETVYQQIINDLKDAQELLPDDYTAFNGERVRANRFAASALLARVYLFLGDWQSAEIHATSVIENVSMYQLADDLNEVFYRNSSEAILQWWSETRPRDRATFRIIIAPPIYGALRPELVSSFEAGDLRRINWISETDGYYDARKYKTTTSNPPTEYTTILRLAEQYLIRAEARVHLGNLAGAAEDIDVVRSRAGLDGTAANDEESLLATIAEERRHEFFTEWGHRWLDLKRTGRADAVLSSVKGENWQAHDVLYPIPAAQILNSSGMRDGQNPGYDN